MFRSFFTGTHLNVMVQSVKWLDMDCLIRFYILSKGRDYSLLQTLSSEVKCLLTHFLHEGTLPSRVPLRHIILAWRKHYLYFVNYCIPEDCLYGLVVRVPGYRSRGPGSIPNATKFSEKLWVSNGVHSTSWVQLRSYLKEKVAALV
jgi:hypothetical protein